MAVVQQAKSALRHQDIIGHVQQGRGVFGLGESRPLWHKATPFQRRILVVGEVRQQEQAMICAKAISQVKEGQWMRWEGVERFFIIRHIHNHTSIISSEMQVELKKNTAFT